MYKPSTKLLYLLRSFLDLILNASTGISVDVFERKRKLSWTGKNTQKDKEVTLKSWKGLIKALGFGSCFFKTGSNKI